MRITHEEARRLGLEPKKTPLTPAAKALARASRERHEDLLWSQLLRYATLLWVQKVSDQVIEWSTIPQSGVRDQTVTSFIARRQYEFLDGRKFKTDIAIFANPGVGLLVEVDGGLFIRGNRSHGGGVGREADMERDALAIIDGWSVLRVSPRQVKNGKAIQWITSILEGG